MHVSFLELYNEDLVDLLNPRPRSAAWNSWGGLSIREDGAGTIVWTGVREEKVESPADLVGYLRKGSLCRTTGSTDMNASSSRSHAIFSILLRQEKWVCVDGEEDGPMSPATHPDGAWKVLCSKFHFVDLAGSERLKRTNAAGERKKEGISINQGKQGLLTVRFVVIGKCDFSLG